MKIAVTGKIKADVDKLKKRIKDCSYKITQKNPDIVVSFGGDGSFLLAEREYPGVPKYPIRDKSICRKCSEGDLLKLLGKLLNKEYSIKKFNKIEATIKKGNRTIRKTAANDIVIRNHEPFHALRFRLKINNVQILGVYNGSFIGDGIVVATPFGSTGYFHSISRKSFNKGVGVAFNNVTEYRKPIVMENQVIRLTVTRNKATVSADNDPDIIVINEKDRVEIRKSKEILRKIELR